MPISHLENPLSFLSRKSVSFEIFSYNILILASQWGLNSNLRVTGQGLLVRNMIVKTCSTTRLRSLGANIHMKGRLVGNSALWIFTRVDESTNDIPACRPIIMLRKMVDTQRVFCVFGHKSPSVQVNSPHDADEDLNLSNQAIGLSSMNSTSFR